VILWTQVIGNKISTPLNMIITIFITAEGLMNVRYADDNRSLFNDASTDQLDKEQVIT